MHSLRDILPLLAHPSPGLLVELEKNESDYLEIWVLPEKRSPEDHWRPKGRIYVYTKMVHLELVINDGVSRPVSLSEARVVSRVLVETTRLADLISFRLHGAVS